jgi:hypothetical protein
MTNDAWFQERLRWEDWKSLRKEGGGIRREGDEAVAVARGGVLSEGMGRPRTTDYSTTDQGGGKSEIRNKFKLAEKGKMSKTGGRGYPRISRISANSSGGEF